MLTKSITTRRHSIRRADFTLDQQSKSHALYIVGNLYWNGLKDTEDYRPQPQKALSYYEAAAKAGNPDAMAKLADIYSHGLCKIPQDLAKAQFFLDSAAKLAPEEFPSEKLNADSAYHWGLVESSHRPTIAAQLFRFAASRSNENKTQRESAKTALSKLAKTNADNFHIQYHAAVCLKSPIQPLINADRKQFYDLTKEELKKSELKDDVIEHIQTELKRNRTSFWSTKKSREEKLFEDMVLVSSPRGLSTGYKNHS